MAVKSASISYPEKRLKTYSFAAVLSLLFFHFFRLGFSGILRLSGVVSINHKPGNMSCKNPVWRKLELSSGPILGFSGWFGTGNGSEISFNIFSGEAIENLLFCNCAKFTTFPFLSPAGRVRKVHGQAAAGLDSSSSTKGFLSPFLTTSSLSLSPKALVHVTGHQVTNPVKHVRFTRMLRALSAVISEPILGFSASFGIGNGSEISFNIFSGEAIENLFFYTALCSLLFHFFRQLGDVHGSCPEINHLLADSLDIIIATDGDFNRRNLMHLIATVVLLAVITGRIVEFHLTDAFLVTPFEARGQCEVLIIAA
nr:hypothetical protein Iba_chr01aCG17410 [Ipomoea batatas]